MGDGRIETEGGSLNRPKSDTNALRRNSAPMLVPRFSVEHQLFALASLTQVHISVMPTRASLRLGKESHVKQMVEQERHRDVGIAHGQKSLSAFGLRSELHSLVFFS